MILGVILGVFSTLFSMFVGSSFGIAFYMGYVWNVYEVGMAYALFLHELCLRGHTTSLSLSRSLTIPRMYMHTRIH